MLKTLTAIMVAAAIAAAFTVLSAPTGQSTPARCRRRSRRR